MVRKAVEVIKDKAMSLGCPSSEVSHDTPRTRQSGEFEDEMPFEAPPCYSSVTSSPVYVDYVGFAAMPLPHVLPITVIG